MTRVAILAGLGFLLHAISSALSLPFASSGLPFAPAVVLVAYAALAEPPVEATLSASVLGFVMDALSGTPLGLNMLACVLALVAARPLAHFVASPRSVSAFIFTAGLSAGYSIFVRAILAIFARESFGFQGVFTTAVTNGLFALLFLPVLSWAMIRLGLAEKEQGLTEKLARRAARHAAKNRSSQ